MFAHVRSMRPIRCLALILAVIGAQFLSTGNADAYCVYNHAGTKVDFEIKDGSKTLRTHTIAAGGSKQCSNYKDSLGLARTKTLKVWATTKDWICIVSMQAGGWTSVHQTSRDGLAPPFTFYGVTGPGVPPDLYCISKNYDGTVRSDSRPTGLTKSSGLSADRRRVRFFATADTQYWEAAIVFNPDQAKAITMNASSNLVTRAMLYMLKATRTARGIIIAGDLTQGGKSAEKEWYLRATAGNRRFFFDGVGNHDIGIIDDFNLKTVQRNTRLTNRFRQHYSWDWDDVHFVQLNIFAGDKPSGNYLDKDPDGALNFLKWDLKKSVADTGRPVVLIQHYGFDNVSTGKVDPEEIWWTTAQRTEFLVAIKQYNVIAILSGHQHLRSTSGIGQWKLNVKGCGSGTTDGIANSCVNLVSGAARGSQDGEGRGVFLDVLLDECNQMIVTRRGRYGGPIVDQTVTIPFSAPGTAKTRCIAPSPTAAVPPKIEDTLPFFSD